METPKMLFLLLNETEQWRYAVRNAKIGRYAVRKGGGGVTLIFCRMFTVISFW